MNTDPMTLAREVLDLAHEDETVTVCTIPDNKAAALARAVLHLAADDLRDTPAGRALMAEAWDEGKTDAHYWWEMGGPWRAEITITNPYKETPDE